MTDRRDYCSEHLAWIGRTKSFIPRYAYDYEAGSYLEVMKMVYKNCQNNENIQGFAKACYEADKKWHRDCYNNNLMAETAISHFVTLNFNHQTWSIKKCLDLLNRILSFDWIESAKCAFELHRANGDHPHIHMLIESKECKSKVLEKIWATAGIKKIMLKKSFIDYKIGLPCHQKYIVGDKQESKMPYVEKDRLWRKENNIQELYEK